MYQVHSILYNSLYKINFVCTLHVTICAVPLCPSPHTPPPSNVRHTVNLIRITRPATDVGKRIAIIVRAVECNLGGQTWNPRFGCMCHLAVGVCIPTCTPCKIIQFRNSKYFNISKVFLTAREGRQHVPLWSVIIYYTGDVKRGGKFCFKLNIRNSLIFC